MLKNTLKFCFLLMLPVLFVGCSWLGATGKPESSKTIPGKIAIKYQFMEADRRNPPAGFNVYRSSSPFGPFDRVNEELIDADKGSRTGAVQLVYTDKGVILGEEYFYYLEARNADGKFRKATDITRAVAVLPLIERPPDAKKEISKTTAKNKSETQAVKSNDQKKTAQPPKGK